MAHGELYSDGPPVPRPGALHGCCCTVDGIEPLDVTEKRFVNHLGRNCTIKSYSYLIRTKCVARKKIAVPGVGTGGAQVVACPVKSKKFREYADLFRTGGYKMIVPLEYEGLINMHKDQGWVRPGDVDPDRMPDCTGCCSPGPKTNCICEEFVMSWTRTDCESVVPDADLPPMGSQRGPW